MTKGIPFIIAAPSGCGKTSLVAALTASESSIKASVSYTTRPMRPGEKNGVNYHFIEELEFKELIKVNALLEYAKVFDYYYGTSKEWVQQQLEQGFDIILEIDWQGAQQIRQRLEEVISIFILPPSLKILEHRLKKRGQDDEAVILKRMQLAQAEMAHFQEFDYIVINDDFNKAIADLSAIIRTEHLKCKQQLQKLSTLINNLLS